MIAAVRRDGYVIAQEFVSGAEEGDVRVFMMNGHVLEVDGKHAAFRRTQAEGDIRSNVHAGGSASPVVLDERIFRLAEMVRPRLVQDGMFLVGVDVIGDKIAEINVCSPGGLSTAGQLYGVDFAGAVIEALERKTDYVGFYHRSFDNADMATL
jgi:glutathione synthase